MCESLKNFYKKKKKILTLVFKSFVEKLKLPLQIAAALKLIQYFWALTFSADVY